MNTRDALLQANSTYRQFAGALSAKKMKPPAKGSDGRYTWTSENVEELRRAIATDRRRKAVSA